MHTFIHHPHYSPNHLHKVGEKMVGFPNEIINRLFPDADGAEWAMENIINEGNEVLIKS